MPGRLTPGKVGIIIIDNLNHCARAYLEQMRWGDNVMPTNTWENTEPMYRFFPMLSTFNICDVTPHGLRSGWGLTVVSPTSD